jgi:hypothetical protein
MAESVHRRNEIANAAIRCRNRIRFEAEKLDAMAQKIAELDLYLENQGIFERIIKELNGKNDEIRAYRNAQEAGMTRCLQEIAVQILRQNRIVGDMLDFVASQMGDGGDRDCIQRLANAYHIPTLMVSEPCKATN